MRRWEQYIVKTWKKAAYNYMSFSSNSISGIKAKKSDAAITIFQIILRLSAISLIMTREFGIVVDIKGHPTYPV